MKTVDILETSAASDLKVRSRIIIDIMKVCEY